jgi:1-acyl-sn-glycerol-3-phosphate acyltransferase
MKIPVIREWTQLRGILPLDRSNARSGAETMIKVIKQAKKGQPIFVFPEGTRSKTGELLDFKPGAFKLALKSKQPIIPFVINDLYKHKFFKRVKGKIIILDPITYEEYQDMNTKQLSELVYNRIKENLR